MQPPPPHHFPGAPAGAAWGSQQSWPPAQPTAAGQARDQTASPGFPQPTIPQPEMPQHSPSPPLPSAHAVASPFFPSSSDPFAPLPSPAEAAAASAGWGPVTFDTVDSFGSSPGAMHLEQPKPQAPAPVLTQRKPALSPDAAAAAPKPAAILRPAMGALYDDPPPTFADYFAPLRTAQFISGFILTLLLFCFLLFPLFFLAHEFTTQQSASTQQLDVFCPRRTIPAAERAPFPPWQTECIPCPAHGVCDGRTAGLQCQPGYFRVHHQCVARTTATTRALELKERVIAELEEHAGRRVCGDFKSRGSRSADLSLDELMQSVLPFHPSAAERRDFDRAWSFTKTWLTQEATYVQKYRAGRNPTERLLVLNINPKAVARFRAVFPKCSVTCRMKRTLHARYGPMLLGALLLALLTYVVFGLRFWLQLRSGSKRVAATIVARVREDYYFDYDRNLLLHQAHSTRELRAEFAGGRGTDPAGQLRARLLWRRVQSILAREPHVEKGTHAFQFGVENSYRWIGPKPASAEGGQGRDMAPGQALGFGAAFGGKLHDN